MRADSRRCIALVGFAIFCKLYIFLNTVIARFILYLSMQLLYSIVFCTHRAFVKCHYDLMYSCS